MAFPTGFSRPKLAQTLTEATSLQYKLFLDATNNRVLIHHYLTAGGQLRLVTAISISTAHNGVNSTDTIKYANYEEHGDVIYDPTDLASATAGVHAFPANAKTIGVTEPVNLDTLYTLAGDARANS